MPANTRLSNSINLLPGQRLESTTGGKVVKWLLSTFRMIVILVQVVVILGFATRVFVDARLSTLNRSIEERYALVKSYQNIEQVFKNKKLKLETFQQLQNDSNSYLSILQSVSREMPTNVQLVSIEKTGEVLKIKALTNQEATMYTFATRLSSVPDIQNVQVVEIREESTTSGSQLSEFTIQATVPSLTKEVS
jgi:Tfp pilus assembly protein PilN